jgi:VWFA-related protein
MNVKPARFFTFALSLMLLAPGLSASRRQDAPPSPYAQAAPIVTVPVRVVDAGRFVSGLALSDFELLEDGVPQRIQALYLIDKDAIAGQEGEEIGRPAAARHFYLLFQMYDYDAKIAPALAYFFKEVLLPGDTLEVQTPAGSYTLTAQALAQKPRDLLAKETNELVRKDINKTNFIYKSLLRDLRRIVQGIQGYSPIGGDDSEGGMISTFSLEQVMDQYRDALGKLESQQSLDPAKITGFAEALRRQPGRKFLILFYQEEYRPEINTTTLNRLIDTNQDNQSILADLHELFQVYHRNISIDVERIVQAYCDSGAGVDFLFMRRTPDKLGGVSMREQSEDIFKLFTRVAEATGGIAETTQNPLAELKGAVRAFESYYLLAYTPSPGVRDGSFRRISVSVKDKPYKVYFRHGYIAR